MDAAVGVMVKLTMVALVICIILTGWAIEVMLDRKHDSSEEEKRK